jgi:hypothetical protein
VVFSSEKTHSYYSTFLDRSSIAYSPLSCRACVGATTAWRECGVVEWISSVHAPLEGSQTVLSHPRIMEFLKLMENKLARGHTKTLKPSHIYTFRFRSISCVYFLSFFCLHLCAVIWIRTKICMYQHQFAGSRFIWIRVILSDPDPPFLKSISRTRPTRYRIHYI